MSGNITVKNVPDEVLRALHNRAAANQRTLQAELLHILKQAARNAPSVTMDDLLEKAQRKRPALDEATSKVLAARDAEQQRTARRFEDLLGEPDAPLDRT